MTVTLDDYSGAQSSGPFELHFGDPAAEAARALHETIAVPLIHLALIEARGADVATFLQGQLSNDVRKLTADAAQLGSFNSPKGRMLAVLHLLRAGEAVLLELPRAILETMLKRLRLYVLRSKVTLREGVEHALFGLAGPEAKKVLKQLKLPAPAAPLACQWQGDVCVVRRLGVPPRYTVLVPAARTAAFWEELAARARPAGTQAWKLLEIEAGVPSVYPETQDHFVPQMCNLDQLGGISFDKGCYTGQEIVARVHYRGAVKRHMGKVITQQTGIAPGSTVDLPDGRTAEVVESAPHPTGGTAALVVAAEK